MSRKARYCQQSQVTREITGNFSFAILEKIISFGLGTVKSERVNLMTVLYHLASTGTQSDYKNVLQNVSYFSQFLSSVQTKSIGGKSDE